MSSIAGNTSTTATLAVGATATNSITAAGDADWYGVTLAAGMSYSFTVQSNGGPGIGLPGPDLRFFDTNGIQLDSVTNFSGTTAIIAYRVPTAGAYFVGIGDYNQGETGQYRVSWVATDNIRNDIATAAKLTANGTVKSTLDVAADADWFALSMTSGLSYGFEARAGGSTNLLEGSDIQLRDAAGNIVESRQTFSGTFNEIDYNATSTGAYFLSVSDSAFDTGDYSLRWVATDNVQNNVSTTSSLVRNATVASRLDVGGDADWFRLSMTSGLSYGFEVRGASTDLLNGSDIQVRDAAGNVLDSSQTFSGTANDLSFHASASANYLLSVNDTANDVGGYTVRWVTTDTIQNNITTASTLGRNAATTSVIDVEGDSDWFEIKMNAGESYGFQVFASGTNQLQWGDLQLRDAEGNIIGSFNATSSSVNTLGFTASATGTYYISVNEISGDTGAYVLRNIGADTVRSNVSTNSRLADGTQLNGRIDMLADSDWHRFETQEGVSYKFTVTGDGSINDLASATLILRDASGNIVGQFSGDAPFITYQSTGSGPVFLEVRGASSSNTGAYTLAVVSDAGTIRGTNAADRLQGGDGATVMNGLDGADRIDGGKGDDRLFGSDGKDRLYGNADNDRLYGGDSKDKLFGGSGRDTLDGGAGNDTLTGDSGSDVFVFAPGTGADRITDFQDGADRIQISGGPSGFGGLTLATVDENVRITFGNTSILVADITVSELASADFLFT